MGQAIASISGKRKNGLSSSSSAVRRKASRRTLQPQRRIGKILTSDRKGGPSEGYEIALYGKLQDKKWASGYLAECMKEDPDTFLVGLKHVVTANGGMAKISKMTHLNRESLYRALSEKGNPSLEYVRTILSVLGIELTVKQKA